MLTCQMLYATLRLTVIQAESQQQPAQRMSLCRLLSPGVTANLPRAMRLRYLLILDFEATCDDSGRIVPKDESEIIEFPTLLYDVDENKVQATFHEYVRPTRHPNLTSFCTDLTGIGQVGFCLCFRVPPATLTSVPRTRWTPQIPFPLCGNGTRNSCGNMASWINLVLWRVSHAETGT